MVRCGRGAAVVALMALAAAGCGGGDDEGRPEATEPAAPEVTLTIGTVDPPSRPASDDVKELAERVEALSDGRIEVTIAWDYGQGRSHRYEHLGEQVRAGELDLGLVPAGT